jgi:hypothetical protein
VSNMTHQQKRFTYVGYARLCPLFSDRGQTGATERRRFRIRDNVERYLSRTRRGTDSRKNKLQKQSHLRGDTPTVDTEKLLYFYTTTRWFIFENFSAEIIQLVGGKWRSSGNTQRRTAPDRMRVGHEIQPIFSLTLILNRRRSP